jgi:hypothetical protein
MFGDGIKSLRNFEKLIPGLFSSRKFRLLGFGFLVIIITSFSLGVLRLSLGIWCLGLYL